MKPCPRCHSTEHLRIDIADDFPTDALSAEVSCTECRVFAQRYYVFTSATAKERPDDAQVTEEVIRQWNEQCDDWEGMFDHER